MTFPTVANCLKNKIPPLARRDFHFFMAAPVGVEPTPKDLESLILADKLWGYMPPKGLAA